MSHSLRPTSRALVDRLVRVLASAAVLSAASMGSSTAAPCTGVHDPKNRAIDAFQAACQDPSTIGTGLGPMLAANFRASGGTQARSWTIETRNVGGATSPDGRAHLERFIRASCAVVDANHRGYWAAPPVLNVMSRDCSQNLATVEWTIRGDKEVHLPDGPGDLAPYKRIPVSADSTVRGIAELRFDAQNRVESLTLARNPPLPTVASQSADRGTKGTQAAAKPTPNEGVGSPDGTKTLGDDTCGLVYGTVTIDGHAPANGTVLEAVDSRTIGSYPAVTMNGTTSNYSFGSGLVEVGTYTLRANGVLASQDCGACVAGTAHWCNATVNTGGGGCNPTVTIQHAMRKLDLDVAFAVAMPIGLVLGRRLGRRAKP